MKVITSIICVSLFFIGCSKGGGGTDNAPNRPQYEGDVSAKAKEIFAKENESEFYSCDFAWRDTALQITQAVEENRQNIETLVKSPPKRNGLEPRKLQFGPFEFFDYGAKPEARDEWVTDDSSWAQAESLYLQVRADKTAPGWRALNSLTRSLILEDEDRILYWRHPNLTHSNKETVLAAKAALESCELKPPCTVPDLAPQVESWLREGPTHEYLLSRLSRSDVPYEKKRRYVHLLKQNLSAETDRYSFYVNPTIHLRGSVLDVPLKLEAFGADGYKVARALQLAWSQYGLELRVREATPGEEAYAVAVSRTPGKRASVAHKEKLMQLYAPVRTSTLEHEFGHVLGLRDTYFTSFDKSACKYQQESNIGDLMSDAANGPVLPSHISAIKAAYGLQ